MPQVAEPSPEARDDLAESGRVVRIPAGWTPIHQQEPADKAYLLLEGRLCVLRGGQDVADIRVGELAGEMGLVDHRLRNAQLTATEPVQILAWPADVFQAVRSRHDDVDRLVRACAEDRYRTEVGWLDSKHSFSFGHHHDHRNTHHGLLLVNDDDVVHPGTGFDTHPHRDMEIVTWVLRGSLVHQDSTGHNGVIYPGLAQRMSAGTGILHSEKNDSWRTWASR